MLCAIPIEWCHEEDIELDVIMGGKIITKRGVRRGQKGNQRI